MVIVGYEFRAEDGLLYFIAKNSWRPLWGINGYGKISSRLLSAFSIPCEVSIEEEEKAADNSANEKPEKAPEGKKKQNRRGGSKKKKEKNQPFQDLARETFSEEDNWVNRMEYLLLSNEIIAELVPKEKRKERTQKLTEEDEDQLLFKKAAYALSGKGRARLVDPPNWIKEEVMTEYEMAGVKKLLKLYENHMNGLIATDMGLSKFKQVLCFLGYLSKFMAIKGPHLIISPDMDKWMTEIKRILPSLRATKDMGAPLKKKSFQIYVTNEQNLSEKKTRAKKKWEYIIVDGAPQSDISLVREGNERTRCLHIINSPLKVLHLFFFGRSRPDNGEQWPQMAEVVLEVGMSSMQKKKLRELYKMPQDPTHDAYNVDQALKQAVQLLKCSNHPFLFKKSKFCDSSKEELIQSAGKMVLLDELLPELELKGSKILLFSQVCGMLDIIEEYLRFREYQFVRIDENSTLKDCNEAADSFSSPAKKIFICLLSTRVGVLSGLPADTVILYDSSWNQNTDWEAQYCAMSEVVQVYRLSTMRTFEQSLIDRLYPPIDEDGEDDEAMEDDDPYFADVDSLVMGMRWHGPTICESEKSTIATVDEIVRKGVNEMDKNIRKILAHKNLKKEEEEKRSKEGIRPRATTTGEVGGPDLRSFTQQFPADSKGDTVGEASGAMDGTRNSEESETNKEAPSEHKQQPESSEPRGLFSDLRNQGDLAHPSDQEHGNL